MLVSVSVAIGTFVLVENIGFEFLALWPTATILFPHDVFARKKLGFFQKLALAHSSQFKLHRLALGDFTRFFSNFQSIHVLHILAVAISQVFIKLSNQ